MHYLLLPCIFIQWPHFNLSSCAYVCAYVGIRICISNCARSLKWFPIFSLVKLAALRVFSFAFLSSLLSSHSSRRHTRLGTNYFHIHSVALVFGSHTWNLCMGMCIKLKPVVEWLPKCLNWISFALSRKLSCLAALWTHTHRVCFLKALEMNNNNQHWPRCDICKITKPSWLRYGGLKTSGSLS